MSCCYVRLIDRRNWLNIKNINELNGEAITVDWNCRKNEWSVYEFINSSDISAQTALADRIVLRMVADNLSKTRTGVTLLLLDNKFFKKIIREVKKDSPLLGCRHCNIRGINFKDIKNAITYTFNSNENEFINRNLSYISKLFRAMTVDDKKNYVDYVKSKSMTPEQTLKQINNVFIKEQKNFFNI